MTTPNQGETAKIIRDLLRIAKVAMPPKLFGEDPRVTRAIALLASLETGLFPSRAPNVSSRPPGFDVTVLAAKRAVEESAAGISFVVDLPWDIAAALTNSDDPLLPLDPADAVTHATRTWLASGGHLPSS